MPFRLTDHALSDCFFHSDQRSLAPLLYISSHADMGGEPLWLDFCDYLVNPAQVGSPQTLAHDLAYQGLRELAQALWGSDDPSDSLPPLSIEILTHSFLPSKKPINGERTKSVCNATLSPPSERSPWPKLRASGGERRLADLD